MNNYREIRNLQINEMEEQFYNFLNKEWDRILAKQEGRRFTSVQGYTIAEFWDVGCARIDIIVNELLLCEEKYLGDASNVSSKHFIELTEDATNICRKLSSIVLSKVRQFAPNGDDLSVWVCETPTIDSIIRRINLVEKKYNAGLIKSSNVTPSKPLSQNYNFYGNVGAVQTGTNATANIIQNLNDEDRSAIKDALQQTRSAIRDAAEIGADEKGEIIEITNECEAQINSGHPNNAKLMALLTVLGTTVQSIASAPAAYTSLKAALLPLGISLP